MIVERAVFIIGSIIILLLTKAWHWLVWMMRLHRPAARACAHRGCRFDTLLNEQLCKWHFNDTRCNAIIDRYGTMMRCGFKAGKNGFCREHAH